MNASGYEADKNLRLCCPGGGGGLFFSDPFVCGGGGGGGLIYILVKLCDIFLLAQRNCVK